MKYYVEIQFKKGPSFSVNEVEAINKDGAKALVIMDAYKSGFWTDQPVKKVIIKEIK